MGTTEEVAQFIVHTTLEQIPPEAIQVAKGALVDGLGIAIAGPQTATGSLVSRWGLVGLCADRASV